MPGLRPRARKPGPTPARTTLTRPPQAHSPPPRVEMRPAPTLFPQPASGAGSFGRRQTNARQNSPPSNPSRSQPTTERFLPLAATAQSTAQPTQNRNSIRSLLLARVSKCGTSCRGRRGLRARSDQPRGPRLAGGRRCSARRTRNEARRPIGRAGFDPGGKAAVGAQHRAAHRLDLAVGARGKCRRDLPTAEIFCGLPSAQHAPGASSLGRASFRTGWPTLSMIPAAKNSAFLAAGITSVTV